jgi:hypothetical protein
MIDEDAGKSGFEEASQEEPGDFEPKSENTFRAEIVLIHSFDDAVVTFPRSLSSFSFREPPS